jgi:hypothetical protein
MVNSEETCSTSFRALFRFVDCRSERRSSAGRSCATHGAQQIIEFEEGVFEAAEETAEEDEKRAEKIAKTIGEKSQKLALIATLRPMSAGLSTVLPVRSKQCISASERLFRV